MWYKSFFSDPWPKKKHHKRRLIQTDFIKSLLPKLKTGGELHLATDWENYAEQMMDVLSNEPALTNCVGEKQFYINDGRRPETRFERRGKKLGHDVWDLLYYKP